MPVLVTLGLQGAAGAGNTPSPALALPPAPAGPAVRPSWFPEGTTGRPSPVQPANLESGGSSPGETLHETCSARSAQEPPAQASFHRCSCESPLTPGDRAASAGEPWVKETSAE